MPSPIQHAVILAGGKSSRMGLDKSLLLIAGIPMLERIARTAAAAGLATLIVGQSPPPPRWPRDLAARFLPDVGEPFSGPVAGLIDALEFLAAPVLLLACDLPLLRPQTLAALLAAHAAAPPGTRATLALSTDLAGTQYVESTFSVYTPAILPDLHAMFRSNRRSFQPLLRAGAIQAWPIPPQFATDLLNVNDPEALAQAEAILKTRTTKDVNTKARRGEDHEGKTGKI